MPGGGHSARERTGDLAAFDEWLQGRERRSVVLPEFVVGRRVLVVTSALYRPSRSHVANVLAAGGYAAVLIFNRTASDACNGSLGMSVEGDIPTFGVAPREQCFAIFGVETDRGTSAAHRRRPDIPGPGAAVA